MSKNYSKELLIIILAILVIIIVFLFKNKKKSTPDNIDNFFGDLGENYIEDKFSDEYEASIENEEDEITGKLVPANGGLPTNKADGGNCVTKDYIKINLPNNGTTPITVGLNTPDSEFDNQAIAQYNLDNASGDGDISSDGFLYVSQGAGVGTVSVINSYNSTSNTITIPSTSIPPFSSGSGFDNNVFAIAVQPDGKILVGGGFTTYQGIAANNIIRLNSDGTKDASFDNSIGFNGGVFAIAIQTDGKILAGGGFTTYKGVGANHIIRLNTDGSEDTTFNNNIGFDLNVNDIKIQANGKIVVAGAFNLYKLVANNSIIRLNSDGTKDTSFNNSIGFDLPAYTIAIQADGKMIIGGQFSTYKGFTENRIIRLGVNGGIDPTFNNTTGFDFNVLKVLLQPDGKVLVAGQFTTYKGVSANRIIRLNSDGTKDTSFVMGIGFNGFAYSMALQSDGKILVSGGFTLYQGSTENYIIRLNSDGSKDTSFDNSIGFDAQTLAVELYSGNNIIVGGSFTTYKSIAEGSIVVLDSIGAIQTTTTYQTSIYGVYSPITNCYYQSWGTNILRIDANFQSTTYNTVIATYPVGSLIGFNTNLSVGQDGNILVGNANGAFGYMNAGDGSYLIHPVVIGNAGDITSKAYLDSNGFLYFDFTTSTNIVQLNTNSTSLTYLTYQLFNVGNNSGPFYVYNNSLYYFSTNGFTLYRFNLTALVTDSSLLLPVSNTSGNISEYANRFVISGSQIMFVDPISMQIINTIPLENITISNTVISQSKYLYALSSSGTAQTQIINLLNANPFALQPVPQGGFGVAGRSIFNSILETIIVVTAGGTDNIIRVPNISNDVKAKFDYMNYNPVKVCGIKYTCNTVEQLANPLIFLIIDGVTGVKSDYKITLIDRLSTQQFNNIIYIDDIEPPITLYSNQSIIHTVNPGENVLIFLYEASGINRSNNFEIGPTNSDIGGDILSITSERPIPTKEYFEDDSEIADAVYEEVILESESDIEIEDGEL
jgi:uncharacterized delta-60 repeat protein